MKKIRRHFSLKFVVAFNFNLKLTNIFQVFQNYPLKVSSYNIVIEEAARTDCINNGWLLFRLTLVLPNESGLEGRRGRFVEHLSMWRRRLYLTR